MQSCPPSWSQNTDLRLESTTPLTKKNSVKRSLINNYVALVLRYCPIVSVKYVQIYNLIVIELSGVRLKLTEDYTARDSAND